jgi:hypothetical protein
MTCCCSSAVKGLHNFIHKSWKLQSASLKISHSFHCYCPRKQIWDMSGEPIYLEPWTMLYTTRSLRLMTVQFTQWEHGYMSRVRCCTDKESTYLFILLQGQTSRQALCGKIRCGVKVSFFIMCTCYDWGKNMWHYYFLREAHEYACTCTHTQT